MIRICQHANNIRIQYKLAALNALLGLLSL